MKTNQHFSKYQFKLRLEAFIKSLLVGLASGFVAAFITSLVTWIIDYDYVILLAAGVLVGVSAIVTAIAYFKVFYPTVMSNARRLDRLGLQERLVTMVEYDNDDSYIAQAQREDAKAALSRIQNRDIRIRIAKKIWAALIICAIPSMMMTTVSALAEADVLPSGDEIIDSLIPEEPINYVSVTYDVEGGGYIEGEADQLVVAGTDATTVIAVADDGYAFVEWSDGYNKPYRTDKKVEKDLEVYAIFEQGGDGQGDGEGEGDGAGEGDGDGNGQGQGKGQGQGQGQGQGEGEGEGQGEGEKGDGSSDKGGGKYDDWNQIIDGQTYYRELLEDYRGSLKEYLDEHRAELTKEEIEIIEQYLQIV